MGYSKAHAQELARLALRRQKWHASAERDIWEEGALRRFAAVSLVLLAACSTHKALLQAPGPPSSKPPSSAPPTRVSPAPKLPTLFSVPDLLGLKAKTAKSRIRESGLRSVTVPKVTMRFRPGVVIWQSREPGALAPKGGKVKIRVVRAANPWGYNWGEAVGSDFFSIPFGDLIYNPPLTFCRVFACIGNFWNGRGYVIQCWDRMFSKAGGRQGACSYHGGYYRELYKP